MQTEITAVLQAVAELALKQDQAAAEQRQAFLKQDQVLAHVCQELALIKADVIIIKGVALSDFAGITASTKEDIQAEAELALEHKEEILTAKEFFNPKNPKYRSAAFRQARKEIKEFSIGSVVKSYVGKDVEKGYLVGCGQWVNAQLTKIFGEKIEGKYSRAIRPLVATLTGYYVAERLSNGRLY
jgi:hypothetical protein